MSSKNRWPLISYCSLIIFTNITIFVVLNTKLNFPLYATAVIVPIIFWPSFKYVLDNTGNGKKLKKVYSLFPNMVHKGITLFCLFWSGYFIFKIVIPTLKGNHDKDK